MDYLEYLWGKINSMNRFHLLVAAASSGTGKTTFTLGLLRALLNRGYSVQPFKTGPDYIDTKFHQLACGRESVNLDSFMMSANHIQHLYSKYAASSEACVVEGAMGLFDGYERMKGSSAQVAEILDLPIVLLVNAERTAYSVAPLIYGFKHFRPNLNIAAVVFNRVSSDTQFRYLQDACSDVELPCLGYLPRMKDLEIPSRHLGLSLDSLLGDLPDRVASLIEKHIDMDSLMEICQFDPSQLPHGQAPDPLTPLTEAPLRIAVARDAAFNFIYKENIERLRELGTILFFSPLYDTDLPDADLLYLPGGYPEYYLGQLAGNMRLKNQIRAYAEGGGRLLAECGGMMYLCNSITDSEGMSHEMCGLIDATATMQQMRLHLGYRTMDYRGEQWRGHEFHYSKLLEPQSKSVVQQYNARAEAVETALYRYKNTLASYTHLYWGESNLLALFDQGY